MNHVAEFEPTLVTDKQVQYNQNVQSLLGIEKTSKAEMTTYKQRYNDQK